MKKKVSQFISIFSNLHTISINKFYTSLTFKSKGEKNEKV